MCMGTTTQFHAGHNNNGDEFGLETLLWVPTTVRDGWLQAGRGTVAALGGSQAGVSFIFDECSSEEPGMIAQIQDTLQRTVPIDM